MKTNNSLNNHHSNNDLEEFLPCKLNFLDEEKQITQNKKLKKNLEEKTKKFDPKIKVTIYHMDNSDNAGGTYD